MEGLAQLPSNKLLNNSIRFKKDENQKSKKIKNNEIDEVLYITKSGKEYRLVRTTIRRIAGSIGKVRENISKNKIWLLLRFHHPKINYYYQAETYFINKKDVMIAKTVDRSGTWADIFLLLKRPNESVPTIITSLSFGAAIIGKEKRFRKYASIYFSEYDKLVKRIKSKEFEHDNIQKLLEVYVAL